MAIILIILTKNHKIYSQQAITATQIQITMREIINISVGQAGNQVGYKFWESLCEEHSICPDKGTFTGDNDIQIARSDVYFNEIQGGRFVPRSLLVDLEPAVLGNVQADPKLGKLFNPDSFISAQNGAGNCWAQGYMTEGAEIIDDVLDQVRKQVELTDAMLGFQLMNSIGGGTGSGLGSLLIEKLSEEYSDKLNFSFSILPGSTNGGNSDCVTEPYNSVLALNSLIEHSAAVFPIENAALHRICQKNLKMPNPTFFDINNIVAQVCSNTTSTLRFPGSVNNSDIRKLCTNLVPFPRMVFCMQALAPLVNPGAAKFDSLGVQDVSAQMFDARSLLSNVGDLRNSGRIFTASCLYRGANVSGMEVDQVMSRFKDKNSNLFVEWIPDNLMSSICTVPTSNPLIPKNSVCGTFLTNTSAIAQSFTTLTNSFDVMLKRKAFVHRYTSEGMDMNEFTEAAANVKDLIAEYQQYQDALVDEDEDGMEFEEIENMPESKIKDFANASYGSSSTMANSGLGGSV